MSAIDSKYSLLIQAINKIEPFEMNEIKTILDFFEIVCVGKNHPLVAYKSHTKYIYFINKGFLRLYIPFQDKEYTRFIASEGSFISAFPSFINQKESLEVLESISECELLRISRNDFEKLRNLSLKSSKLIIQIYQQTIISLEARSLELMLLSAEQRFNAILKQHPEYFQSIPSKILASYIGMQPETFSKFKNKFKKSIN
ncbi:MAG: cyclic nucleotide-binding domain-containing protein [Leptospiraceae bacterium]|nr:cyclic nucleotide-binding domain-containing protein [Leptospiraceae bacterium]